MSTPARCFATAGARLIKGQAMSNAVPGPSSLGRTLLLGFIAGALAVAIFHQAMVLLLGYVGLARSAPWSFAPVPPFAVPRLIDIMFWGGVWGVVYAVLIDRLLRSWPLWLVGLVFGLLGPVLFGWTIVALIKGNALFAGFNATRMLASVLINGCYGIGVALIFAGLRRVVAGEHGVVPPSF
jgi:hypothetical protein